MSERRPSSKTCMALAFSIIQPIQSSEKLRLIYWPKRNSNFNIADCMHSIMRKMLRQHFSYLSELWLMFNRENRHQLWPKADDQAKRLPIKRSKTLSGDSVYDYWLCVSLSLSLYRSQYHSFLDTLTMGIFQYTADINKPSWKWRPIKVNRKLYTKVFLLLRIKQRERWKFIQNVSRKYTFGDAP